MAVAMGAFAFGAAVQKAQEVGSAALAHRFSPLTFMSNPNASVQPSPAAAIPSPTFVRSAPGPASMTQAQAESSGGMSTTTIAAIAGGVGLLGLLAVVALKKKKR